MSRFDVYRYSDQGGLLLDCQADALSHFETRFVVPLLPAEGTRSADRLHPIFTVGDRQLIMVTHLASAVPVRDLGAKVTSLAEEHSRVMNALDMLLTGY